MAHESRWERLRRWPVTRRRLLFGGLASAATVGVLIPSLRSYQRARSAPEDTQDGPDAAAAAAPGGSPPTQSWAAGVDLSGTDAILVRRENAQAGTTNWRITNYASAGEIQAYTGRVSVNVGDSLDFFVSTRRTGTTYRIDYYRMGWYGGAGARLAGSVGGLVGQSQGFYTGSGGLIGAGSRRYDASTGLLDANWGSSYRLDVPGAWISGVYLALLTDAAGKQTYVPFVVRQDERPSALLFKASFNTYQAYNAWGGKSLYADNSSGAKTLGGSPGAVKVSFNRPYDADLGSGHFLRYEYNLIRWLERLGYDVSYVADGDLGANAALLKQHRAFISAGHDEYWTAAERGSVEQARSHGVHLAFLSGNTMYWQARYEPSASGDSNRTLVVYRDRSDPLFTPDPAHATLRWTDPPLNRPQHMLTGTIYSGQTEPFTQDWVVGDTSSWVFARTGLKPGGRVPKLVGKEFDRAATDMLGPPGLQILSRSPITVTQENRPANVAYAETTIYTAPSGATVFSAGNVTWSWGLDDASFPIGGLHNTPISPAIQRLTQNLLDRMASAAGEKPSSVNRRS